MSLIDGFSPTGDRLTGVPLKVRGFDQCAIYNKDMQIDLSRLESGKWLLQVNGVKMIFDQRPEFIIPPDA